MRITRRDHEIVVVSSKKFEKDWSSMRKERERERIFISRMMDRETLERAFIIVIHDDAC